MTVLQPSGHHCHVSRLTSLSIAAYHHKVATLCLLPRVRIGQQSRVYMQLFLGIGVEHIEQIARRAVVACEVEDISLTSVFQLVEHLHLCTHKREYGLLFIAKIEHGGFLFSFELVDNSHLQGIEVLHLINLYPAVSAMIVIGKQLLIGVDQQILKVEHTMLLLIFGIPFGQLHLVQQLTQFAALVERPSISIIVVELRIIIYT